MNCVKPIRITQKRKENNPWVSSDGLEVPCGKCFLCRRAKSKEWSLRLYHENEYWEDSSFVTLTYNDEKIPPNGSLVKSDLQKYFKRLRKDLGSRKIKYFACGEYGDNTFRPHYHSIIFGLHPVKDRSLIMDNWPFGFSHIGSVTQESIQYVAKYVYKKLSGAEEDYVYTKQGKQNPFSHVSRGLGLRYCLDMQSDILRDGAIKHRGLELSVPRYYVKKLGISNELHERNAEEVERSERQLVNRYTGIDMTNEELYNFAKVDDVIKHNESLKKMRAQKSLNTETRISMKHSKL